MIVVLAGVVDEESAALASRWSRHGAVLMTPRDLSRAGWCDTVDGSGSTCVAAGRVVPSAAVQGVLVRLPHVEPLELVDLVPSDRSYAGAEMTAFLAHWLTTLDHRVVNRPGPTCLVGPAWSREQWLVEAARLGVDTVDVVVDEAGATVPDQEVPLLQVPVVGGVPVGDVETHPAVARAVDVLARATGAGFFAATFADPAAPRLVDVDVCPPVTDEVADRLLALLVRSAA